MALKIKQVDGLQAALDSKIAASILHQYSMIIGGATEHTAAELAIAAERIVGRAAVGDIVGLTAAQVKTLLGAGAANGLATLNASSKVVEDPSNATATPTASKIPIADANGKLASGWGGAASTLATLNASSKVVEDPANATATPTASKIPIANGSGKLASGWGGAASTLATLNASSKVVEDPANATATPTASKIPIANGSGKLDSWVSASSDSTPGIVELADNTETLTGTDATRAVTPAGLKSVLDGFVAAQDAMIFKGVIDCSANPNYPAAGLGWTYKVSVAGKIGGASGPNVEVGDTLMCIQDGTASGTHAVVGQFWNIVQANLDGAVIGPASAVNEKIAVFDSTSGKLIKEGTKTISEIYTDLTVSEVIIGATGNTGNANTVITITGFFSTLPSTNAKATVMINGLVLFDRSTTLYNDSWERSTSDLKIKLSYALEASDEIEARFAIK